MFIHPSEKKQSVNGKITQLKSMCKETKLKLLKNRFHTIRPRTDVSTSSAAAGRPEPEILMKPQNQSR